MYEEAADGCYGCSDGCWIYYGFYFCSCACGYDDEFVGSLCDAGDDACYWLVNFCSRFGADG